MGSNLYPLFFFIMNQAVKLVADAVLGKECMQVKVGGNIYTIVPPTIKVLAGVGLGLSTINFPKDAVNLLDVFKGMREVDGAAIALSYLIQGDESLVERFKECRADEVISALSSGLELIDIKGFIGLLGLTRNVQSLIAVPR